MPKLLFYKTGVYCWLNTVDGKVYVGSAARSFTLRKREHLNALARQGHYNKHLQAAWLKYGSHSFKFVILCTCSPEECIEKEQYWIDFYGASDPNRGYNRKKRVDSNLGIEWSEDVRLNMSLGARRRLERPEERERLLTIGRHDSEEDKRKCTRRNLEQTEETKKKIAASLTGVKKSPEAVKKTADSQRGRKMSEEQRRLIRLQMMVRQTSIITRKKMSASRKGRSPYD